MARLRIESNIAAPDDLYEALLDAHRGLTLAQSQALNARLVLLLANHVGDVDVVREALARARTLVERLDEEPHLNPSTGTREFALRDPDGYYVMVSALA